jgi:hypothetical protein
MCIDMETATIFMTGFFNEIPTGALLLVSDQPMTPDGVKTAESDQQVDEKFVKDHLRIGIDSLKQLINEGLTVKHLKFEDRPEGGPQAAGLGVGVGSGLGRGFGGRVVTPLTAEARNGVHVLPPISRSQLRPYKAA